MTKTIYPSNLQLLNTIETILSAPSAQAMDTQQLEACLLELQSRAPVAEDYDADGAWEQVLDRFSAEAQTQSAAHRRKPLSRRVRVLIAVAAVLAAIVVTAAALGGKSFLRLLRWEDDRIIFQTVLSDGVIGRYHQVTEYETLEAALVEESQAVDLLPVRLPEGYALTTVTRTKQLGATTYGVKYRSGKKGMKLTIRVGAEEAAIHPVPSTARAYLYRQNGVDFTVYTLDGHWYALWQSGTVNYSLSAPVTEAELLAVLDSVCQQP